MDLLMIPALKGLFSEEMGKEQETFKNQSKLGYNGISEYSEAVLKKLMKKLEGVDNDFDRQKITDLKDNLHVCGYSGAMIFGNDEKKGVLLRKGREDLKRTTVYESVMKIYKNSTGVFESLLNGDENVPLEDIVGSDSSFMTDTFETVGIVGSEMPMSCTTVFNRYNYFFLVNDLRMTESRKIYDRIKKDVMKETKWERFKGMPSYAVHGMINERVEKEVTSILENKYGKKRLPNFMAKMVLKEAIASPIAGKTDLFIQGFQDVSSRELRNIVTTDCMLHDKVHSKELFKPAESLSCVSALMNAVDRWYGDPEKGSVPIACGYCGGKDADFNHVCDFCGDVVK